MELREILVDIIALSVFIRKLSCLDGNTAIIHRDRVIDNSRIVFKSKLYQKSRTFPIVVDIVNLSN